MASLQERNGVWNCVFRYQGKRHWYNLGEVEKAEAEAVSAKVDYFLLRLKQNLLEIPAGCDIITFIQHDGKPPSAEKLQQAQQQSLTLADLRDRYFGVHGNGTLEENTLAGMQQHFKHWTTTLGAGHLISSLTLADLQGHVDRRAKMKGIRGLISPTTIRKEIVTLRTCWNWGVQFGLVTGKFPNKGLRFAKTDEKPPFQTFAEIERKLPGLSKKQAAEAWDSVYLTVPEISELLAYVKEHASMPWLYPMVCFAAYTGARRSEMIRAKISDVDFAAGSIQIYEKKRVRGQRTSRRAHAYAFPSHRLARMVSGSSRRRRAVLPGHGSGEEQETQQDDRSQGQGPAEQLERPPGKCEGPHAASPLPADPQRGPQPPEGHPRRPREMGEAPRLSRIPPQLHFGTRQQGGGSADHR